MNDALIWSPTQSGWRAPAADQASAGVRTAAALHRIDPSEMPSGVNGLRLRAGDHIAVVSIDESPVTDLMVDYLVAGLRDSCCTEHLSFELSEGTDLAAVRAQIEERLSAGVPRRLDIIDWDRNSGDYDPEEFTRDAMHSAMSQEERRLQGDPSAALRVASRNCSAFMESRTNPRDYLMYEYELADDLRSILHDQPFLQLCRFKLETLVRTMDPLGLSPSRTVAHILASHSKWIVAVDGEFVVGRRALSTVACTLFPRSRPALARARLLVAVNTLRAVAAAKRFFRGDLPVASEALAGSATRGD